MGSSSDIELEPRSEGPGPSEVHELLGSASRRSTGSRLVIGLGIVAAVALLSAAGIATWANRQFGEIPTFAEHAPGVVASTGSVLDTTAAAPGTAIGDLTAGIDSPPPVTLPAERGVTFLLFSTGSEALSADAARRLSIPADRASQSDGLTDSIMLVVVYPETGQVGVLSIPRDLYIPQIGDRINTIFNRSGPRALATTVARITGLPVDHMLAVNFSAFGDLTDAVGGVDVWVDGPARDLNTGFEVARPGCVHMDATMALAFARSRHWEIDSGTGWRLDASADDFGRIRRQQALIRAAIEKLASPSGLGSISGAIGVAQRDLIVDPDLDFRQVSGLALDMLGNDQTSISTFSYAGVPGWAGAASVVYTNAQANAAGLAAMQHLLAGQPVDVAAAGGTPAPPAAGPVAATGHSC
jgi:LCP family protein required for cell wall assembly